MESNRTRHSFEKLSGKMIFRWLSTDKGIALPAALLIGVLSLLIIAGIYFALTKLFGTSHAIKTYSSVREAAAGGVHYAVATKVREIYEDAIYGRIAAGECEPPITLNFRLQNISGTFNNTITVCFTGRGEFKRGFGKERVIGSGTGGGEFEYWLLFTIISEATGPQGTRSRVEAVYAK
ncbi:hypothetical protein [Thermodesulfovibrio hydrogeniphilus]